MTRSDQRTPVAVLTTARSEYYQMRPVLRRLRDSRNLALQLLVSGSHLSRAFGRTEHEILEDGFEPAERLPCLVDDDTRLGFSLTGGLTVQMIAGALERQKSEMLVLVGDRFETLAAAVAATSMGVPIAHLHGGEVTTGALDDSCRHAITKLSALHFVSTEVYRARVIQMGESPDRVFTVGAPFVDEMLATDRLSEDALCREIGGPIEHPLALVAYHPATRENTDGGAVVQSILHAAVRQCPTVVVTAPNADPGWKRIADVSRKFAESDKRVRFRNNLGSPLMYSLMAVADVMIGNSSAGIHEAATFGLPVVNVGSRQAGRLRPSNVIDCEPDGPAIDRTIAEALRRRVPNQPMTTSPFGSGNAAKAIVDALEKCAPLGAELLRKRFCDGEGVRAELARWNPGHSRDEQ